jgi:hypothetical protein
MQNREALFMACVVTHIFPEQTPLYQKERGEQGSLAHEHSQTRNADDYVSECDPNSESEVIMNPRKVLMLLAIFGPIALIVGILASFIYTSYYHGSPEVDWTIALSLTVLMSAFFTWYNRRELKDSRKAS